MVRGTKNALDGADANLGDYLKFQKKDGKDVLVFHFPLTPEQDKQILENIENQRYCGPGDCAECVSDVLRGVGPFKDLGSYLFPSNLANKLRQLQQGNGGQKSPDLSSPFLEPPVY